MVRDLLGWFVFCMAIGGWITAVVMLLRARRWMHMIRREIENKQEAELNGGRALHALAMKLSPNGHVDISREEWEAQELLEVRLVPLDGGMRVLAK